MMPLSKTHPFIHIHSTLVHSFKWDHHLICLWPMDPWGCPICLCRRFFSSLNSPGFPSKLRGFRGEEDLELIKDEWSLDHTLLLGPLASFPCFLPSLPLHPTSFPPSPFSLSPLRIHSKDISHWHLLSPRLFQALGIQEWRGYGSPSRREGVEPENCNPWWELLHTGLGELRRGRGWLCWQIQGAWPAEGPEDWHWLQPVNSDRLVYLVGDLLKSH